MNSLRVGMIGVMVDRWGVGMAEGFLHEFQGWAIFMVSAALLLVELIVLAHVGRDRAPWRSVFDTAPPKPASAPERLAKLPEPFVAATITLAVFAGLLLALPARSEVMPQREPFVSFPAQLGNWSGHRGALERIYLDTLQLDDYVLADYRRGPDEVVNLYVAWYDSQRAGQSAHSPRSCLPGGGWRITSLQQVAVPLASGAPAHLNRVQIELGNQKQLVYYWFQQRGRIITNEYLAKWYLFWDSLTRRRTDGALVRLVTPLRTGEDVRAADARLAAFLDQAAPQLTRHIPE
jgi:exosortase D (VPLPA-CTERM-specific)